MNINALNAATALAGIKECTINQVFNCMSKIGIASYIGGVFAAQLQSHIQEMSRSSLLDGAATGHRACKAHHIGQFAGNDFSGLFMVED